MNDDFGMFRKHQHPLGGTFGRDSSTKLGGDPWTHRPGFDRFGHPLCPPTTITGPRGFTGVMYAGLNTLRTNTGATFQVDVQRNVRDSAGNTVGRIDCLTRFAPG